MIRTPPTGISLTREDIEDYDIRRMRHQFQRFLQMQALNEARREIQDDKSPRNEVDDAAERRIFGTGSSAHPHDGLPMIPPMKRSADINPSRIPILESRLAAYRFRGSSEDRDTGNGHHESPAVSPSKGDFNYGGFSEAEGPEDASTPRAQLPTLPRLTRVLPRSPLFLSQNASSPERLVTSSLSPRVESRISTHNAPGMMFAQPARRPRALRHQTNSFSFDSTERASAVYEQDRIASLSSSGRPVEYRSLREELRGSSLDSTGRLGPGLKGYEEALNKELENTTSDSNGDSTSRTSSLTESVHNAIMTAIGEVSHSVRSKSPLNISPTITSGRRVWPPSSPSLPPPFSTTSRAVSESLPITDANPVTNNNAVASRSKILPSSPPSPFGYSNSTRSSLRSAELSSKPREKYTPSSYRVYNDDLPSTSQPQTPAHLPESRHRSRYHPSYTAPVARARAMIEYFNRERNDGGTPQTPATSDRSGGVRRHAQRRDSPVGLFSSGFRGLYGGRENGDDEINYRDGVQFGAAPRRLWNPTHQ